MSGTWHEEARRLRAAGAKQSDLAARFGVTRQAVSLVTIGVYCPVDHQLVASLRNIKLAAAAPRRSRSPKWTPQQDQFLKAHYNLDCSASKIGRDLGFSKNAVIGRAYRLGLGRRSL